MVTYDLFMSICNIYMSTWHNYVEMKPIHVNMQDIYMIRLHVNTNKMNV